MENQQTAGTAGGNKESCSDIGDQIAEMLGFRPETRQHLRNARIEMLKAVRSMIDSRIDRLSQTGQKGTKVPVD